ncbi:sodium channel modifier 1-like [Eucalyptus grandis]|uniref:sodium channel modifier 1-like n=1 Tax=Eucalyptus grandis TaxID=71139 RepID=UPI00192E9DDC|nr:sodium channel modifier 1-like [Eucalyptus grandis]
MSAFGGDSWAREAQHRKRRVDDLAVEGLDASSYKKLSSGKFACLVCPGAPVLDSALMLSMHCKGSHHHVALSRLKETELKKKDEIDKRIALSDCTVNTGTSTSILNRIKSRPLIEQTRKAVSEVLDKGNTRQDVHNNGHSGKICGNLHGNETSHVSESFCFAAKEAAEEVVVQQQLSMRERHERELKFTSAGWKHDCNGRWFKDENVEFDSDEEDPNICLG